MWNKHVENSVYQYLKFQKKSKWVKYLCTLNTVELISKDFKPIHILDKRMNGIVVFYSFCYCRSFRKRKFGLISQIPCNGGGLVALIASGSHFHLHCRKCLICHLLIFCLLVFISLTFIGRALKFYVKTFSKCFHFSHSVLWFFVFQDSCFLLK